MISSPRLPLSLIMKGDMARGRGSSQKETALCRNCHAPPPILTCTGPFVVCRTCKLASPGCHIKAGRYAPVGGKWETTCNQENGEWWTSIQSARSSFPGPPFTHQQSISSPPPTHTHTSCTLLLPPPPPSIPSQAHTYTCKNLFLIFRSRKWREINIYDGRGLEGVGGCDFNLLAA